MAEKIEMPDPNEMAKVLRVSLGPEEEWDDAAVELVLELHGIDPGTAPSRLAQTITRIIQKRKNSGEEIPPTLGKVLSRLTSESEIEDTQAVEARRGIDEMFAPGTMGPSAASNRVLQAFRKGMGDLSENDEMILDTLSSELQSDDTKDV
ncbi:MAG TPA: hypothetical protein DC054_09280 [Blastocatellia bacterium]|nr:hypothetical protein [Blastocatellia bacterium]